MAVISVSYNDHETGTNFDLTKEIRSPHIASSLNAMIDVLRLMGFGDNLIEDYIGETYFSDPIGDNSHDDGTCCCDECI